MCVTNTTYRRSQPVSLPPAATSGDVPSGLTQRLLSTFTVAPAAKPVASHAPAAPSSEFVRVQPPAGKPRPKRRRKPQKPGKTAKMNDRHFVIHNYHDHSADVDENDHEVGLTGGEDAAHRRKGGVAVAFPLKLHAVLDQVEADGLGHIVSWQPHGRCFMIHDPKHFVESVMPKYFRQTKLTSFQRQLNLYGFARLTKGPDNGSYYHELFLRGKTFLCKKMTRTKVKGTRFKAASSPDQEPDFYAMPPITVTPQPTSDEEMSQDSDPSQNTMSYPAAPALTVSQAFDPLPIQFAAPTTVPTCIATAPAPPVPLFYPMPNNSFVTTDESDRVLDEAVDELFLTEGGDDLLDFVQDWDPTNSFAETLENDRQLGYMLEKLLEE